MSIVVDISHIYTHTKLAGMRKALNVLIPEAAIFLVDIQVIIFMKIIADVNIRPTIQVDIRYRYTQAIPYSGSLDSGFTCNIGEFP